MKVICINNNYYPLSLELNKEYEVVENGDYFIITDDNLEDCEYPKELFRLLQSPN